jgi:hypothetical protein
MGEGKCVGAMKSGKSPCGFLTAKVQVPRREDLAIKQKIDDIERSAKWRRNGRRESK